MSGKDKTDALGRKMPSKYMRKKRATKAAQLRWKDKWHLEPGNPKPWNRRSLANKLRHLAAARRGGETTGGRIREQQRLFWRWFHGECKAQLQGPFKTVVETLERIEAAYVQRYGYKSAKFEAWDGFMHHVFSHYILVPCWKMEPKLIERRMWEQYALFLEADDKALYGSDEAPGLLQPLFDYEDEKQRQEQWRADVRSLAVLRNNEKKL